MRRFTPGSLSKLIISRASSLFFFFSLFLSALMVNGSTASRSLHPQTVSLVKPEAEVAVNTFSKETSCVTNTFRCLFASCECVHGRG